MDAHPLRIHDFVDVLDAPLSHAVASLSHPLNRLRASAHPPAGFLPKDTAQHHREKLLPLVRQALDEAAVTPADIDCVCFTQGTAGSVSSPAQHPPCVPVPDAAGFGHTLTRAGNGPAAGRRCHGGADARTAVEQAARGREPLHRP